MPQEGVPKTRIVILGGGFAGVYTAMYLERYMTAQERLRVELAIVSNENYIVFQPLLPEVISGTLETLHCITPIRRLARSAKLYTRTIEAIDLDQKVVRLCPKYLPRPIYLPFDHLVIGLGSRLDYSRVPGMREHAIPFKYLGDALRLRDAAVGVLEEANTETDAEERKKLLTFVVAGGGFSGVECIAELNDFLSTAIRDFRNLTLQELKCVLVQSGPRILPELGESLATYAHRILERRGIEVRLGTRLMAISSDGAMLQDKATGQREILKSRTVVSTIPAAPHELIDRLPCELEEGRIKVSENLDVPGFPGLWAVGDCASVRQKDGITSPPTAQHALRQAKTCARNLLASIRGQPMRPFDFTGLGKLASLGRHSAVADIMGIKLRGLLAWILWRSVYLAKVPGFDRKIRIAMDWTLDLLLPRDITQVRIFQPHDVTPEHFHAGEHIFEAGDFGDKLYVVVRGEVEILKGGVAVAEMGEKEVFGEVALVSEQERTATVRAKTDLDVISVSRPAFKALVAHLPGVQASIADVLRSHGFEACERNEKAPLP